MNKVFLIGNLTRDPERKATGKGETVAELGIAVPSTQKDENGKYTADFFDVSVFGPSAENCLRYLSKGKKVAVEASLKDVHYTDRSGKAYRFVKIVAHRVEFLSPSGTAGTGSGSAPAQADPDSFRDITAEGCPFV